jgi:hypothetical protein
MVSVALPVARKLGAGWSTQERSATGHETLEAVKKTAKLFVVMEKEWTASGSR